MEKGKKTGKKRLSKKELTRQLEDLFVTRPVDTFSLKDIFRILHLTTHPVKMLAVDILEDMAWCDYITKVNESSFKLNNKGQVQDGVFYRRNNGKNVFIAEDGGEPVFVAERNSMFALNGDKVRVSFLARARNHEREAVVVEILARGKNTFVGKLKVMKSMAFLITESNVFVHDIIIPKDKLKGGKTGEKAVVKITKWPDEEEKTIIGEVIDVLGKEGDNDVEMNAILAQYNLPYVYPKNVEDAADKITGEISAAELAKREDMRDAITFTIDPKDAKDFDDALSCKKLDNGLWEIGVHIADVSHYVTEGSVIDKEAYSRATSVYLVDRTVPMLPERLCNFVCSLRPDEEKLCYSVIFVMDEDAMIRDWHLAHTVVKSNRRFAYEEVQAILEDNGVVDGTGEPAPKTTDGKYRGEYAEEIVTLDRLAKALRSQRFKNGSVKFDREELHFDIDKDGKPTRCYFKKSRDANKLIEEFMLLANRTVAEWVGNPPKGKKPKVLPYRVHDVPDPTKLENLRQFITKFGYKVKTTGTKTAISKSINKLMDDINGSTTQKLIETVALRAMMKAKYTTDNIGHYGLAFDYYTHFTSPIRRYPDLMVHRLLTRYQEEARSASKSHYETLCEHCSDQEILAQQAERDSIKYKMVEFMSDKLGNVYDAHISGVTSFGIYCEIDENHCEGLVPMRDLDDDYYDFDERNYCLVGKHKHNKYRLGDAVRIQVAAANLEKKQLDFALADDNNNGKKRR